MSKRKSKTAKRDIYQEVTNKILGLMETRGVDWVRPWAANCAGLPHSVATNKPYRGINTILLWACPYASTRWGTFKAWQAKGAQVRKGERGEIIMYFSMIEKRDTDSGELKTIPLLRYSTVFNAEQVDNAGEEPVRAADKNVVDDAEAFIEGTGAEILSGRDHAFYSPKQDYIGMPDSHLFNSVHDYYGTILHELTHWTGHPKRLSRAQNFEKRSEEYAREELVAELGAAFMCVTLGITAEPRADHAQYLNNWIRALKGDKKAITKAASEAAKAVDYLNDLQAHEQAA